MDFIVRRVSSDIVFEFLNSKTEINRPSPLEIYDNNEDGEEPNMVGIEFETTEEKISEKVAQNYFEKEENKDIMKDNLNEKENRKDGKSDNKELERD